MLVLGILLVVLGPWEFTQFWVLAAIGLYHAIYRGLYPALAPSFHRI